jgi:hypothetical protein
MVSEFPSKSRQKSEFEVRFMHRNGLLVLLLSARSLTS